MNRILLGASLMLVLALSCAPRAPEGGERVTIDAVNESLYSVLGEFGRQARLSFELADVDRTRAVRFAVRDASWRTALSEVMGLSGAVAVEQPDGRVRVWQWPLTKMESDLSPAFVSTDALLEGLRRLEIEPVAGKAMELEALVAQLDAGSIDEREAAERALVAEGALALAIVRRAWFEDAVTTEARGRLERVVAGLHHLLSGRYVVWCEPYAVNASTGTAAWFVPKARGSFVRGSEVFFEDMRVYDLATGELLRRAVHLPTPLDGEANNPGGEILGASGDAVTCRDRGVLVWRTECTGQRLWVMGSRALVGRAWWTDAPQETACLDALTGRVLWRLDPPIIAAAADGRDGFVVTSALHRLDMEDGRVRWTADAGAGDAAEVALHGDAVVACTWTRRAVPGATLLCRSREDGHERWRVDDLAVGRLISSRISRRLTLEVRGGLAIVIGRTDVADFVEAFDAADGKRVSLWCSRPGLVR